MPDPCHTDFIPYARQCLDEADALAVLEVLRSDWLTCGPGVSEFENRLAHHIGAPHVVAVSNGTAALHLILRAAGIGPGDRVLTSANTFVASANVAELVGAQADFVDIDPDTRCLSLQTLQAAWQPDVRAVIAVDFAGYPCVTPAMADFVHAQGAVLIEDACHSLGSLRDGVPVGSLPGVDATAFSFHPVKNITTGEGGAIATPHAEWADACRKDRQHGLEYTGDPEHSYCLHKVGLNYRITDIQCALGSSQLTKLPAFVARRQAIMARYREAFQSVPTIALSPACTDDDLQPSWHLCALCIDFSALGIHRAAFREQLRQQGMGTQIHYHPVHLQPYYVHRYGYEKGKCPNAETWADQVLSIPLFPCMTDQQVEKTIHLLTTQLASSSVKE